MSQGRLSLVKKFRLSPEEAAELTEKSDKMNMTESEYLRFMISQKPTDYPEMRILLRELINEVNHIGTNINQIVHNNVPLTNMWYRNSWIERVVLHR